VTCRLDAELGDSHHLVADWYTESQLTDTATFETTLMDACLRPDEGCGIHIVSFDKGIGMLEQLFDGGEGSAAQRLSLKD
jgi:hypothetical protein